MVRFYDYLFYFIYKFYSGKEKGAFSSSAGIVGGLQAINVLSVLMLFSTFISQKDYYNTITVIIVIVIFQVTTYIRYIYKEKVSIKTIEEKWLNMTDDQKIRIRFFNFLYITLSISVFIGLAIYLGSRS